jgi:hypothetical protein
MPDANEFLRINLREVTSERDAEKRRAATERAYVEDLRFLDSEAGLVGRQAVSDRVRKILDDAPADFVLEDGPRTPVPTPPPSPGGSARPAVPRSAGWTYSPCVTAG